MVSIELLHHRLNQIRESVIRLEKFREMPEAIFLADQDNFAVSEHHIRRSLEAMFDIGRHIIAKKGLGRPDNYREIIEVLGKENIISREFADKTKAMAGYRNRLVHGYAEVTPKEIHSIIITKLDDMEKFTQYIIRFIEQEQTRQRH